MKPGLVLEVVGEVPLELDLTPLQRVVAQLTASEISLPSGIVNLRFVGDEEMRAFNRDYAGNDYATDVLAFNYLEAGGAIEDVIGEMLISLDTATRQAGSAKTSLAEEVALLGLHGLLHIGGYDHRSPQEQVWVQELQATMMAEAGYAYRQFTWEEPWEK